MAEYEELEIKSFDEFCRMAHKPSKGLYRGESQRYETRLLPKIARNKTECLGFDIEKVERSCLELFELHGTPYLPYGLDSWRLLAIAQHHGLATRLLDWTYNPAVALYFAVHNDQDIEEDGYIYSLHGLKRVDIMKSPDPLKITEPVIYYPHRDSPRIAVQDGVFTVHPHPFEETMLSTLTYRIPASLKKEFVLRLDTLGFTQATLFPGLDGLASWLCESKGFNNK